MRVLKWIVDRCTGRAGARETPLGWVPGAKDVDLEGMSGFGPDQFEKVQEINVEEWKREIISQDELFIKLYPDLPKEMIFQRELLISRL
jgi:phosphoenolpyruvate carboxykinase (GTP)